jgi:hypothetical protein
MRKTITVILLVSITIAVVSVIHTILPQSSSAVYAQVAIKISIPLSMIWQVKVL